MGGSFSRGVVRNWLLLCSDFLESRLSGVGENGKGVLAAASVIVDFRFDYFASF
jgi:hypothetical protein